MQEGIVEVNYNPLMILAGDIGATKTLLALFERRPVRPVPIAVRSFQTMQFQSLGDMVAAFLASEGVNSSRIEATCVGVAGPVLDGRSRLTNVAWAVVASDVRDRYALPEVVLLNDLEAMAWSVSVLAATELETLQEGEPAPLGNAALIAAGTGLGMAILLRAGATLLPVASEGGHADFPPRTTREVQLLNALTEWYGRAQWENIVSGPGLVNLHRFTHETPCLAVPSSMEPPEKPSAISTAALERRCSACIEALDLFSSIYGSAAGNLALTAAATGGVYVGGGIAPKILPALRRGQFMAAFRAKAPMQRLLARTPVHIILNPEAGLLGAAVRVNSK
jgi:glucokinase